MKLAKTSIPSKEKGSQPGQEPVGWTLTSGKRLEEFAEQGGYLAPLLLLANDTPALRDWVKKQD